MSGHKKRLNAPKTRKVKKKGEKWITKSSAGPHPAQKSVPLKTVIRNHLELTEYGKEAERIIKGGKIEVDGRKIKKSNYPVGFMDVMTIKPTDEHYRAGYSKKGKMEFIPIEEDEAKYKLGRVKKKTKKKGGKTQITLHDGKNLIKEDVDIGDSVKITLPDGEIEKTIKMEKGNKGYIISGKHAGEILEITKVMSGTRQREPLVELGDITTQKTNVFPIGEKESELKIGE